MYVSDNALTAVRSESKMYCMMKRVHRIDCMLDQECQDAGRLTCAKDLLIQFSKHNTVLERVTDSLSVWQIAFLTQLPLRGCGGCTEYLFALWIRNPLVGAMPDSAPPEVLKRNGGGGGIWTPVPVPERETIKKTVSNHVNNVFPPNLI